jgi:hypothetical protein
MGERRRQISDSPAPEGCASIRFQRNGTLVQRQKIIIPVAIGIRAQVSGSSTWPHDANVGSLTVEWVDYIEGVRLGIDAGDDLFAKPFPSPGRIANMSYMFARAFGVRLADAGDLYVSH